ncbi:MAG TPA: SRPBCC domain-containing protein [Micromonosporaceae bacterium]|jgi:uncharacterized protein YndB with AHSA1/START domain|nr:SRPBCC domain-containing protein [Micromonosporaceae bacterium]
MTGNVRGSARILGSLGSADGKGVVRMEDRYSTNIEDLWSAITDPLRLARWLGEIKGDLTVGGTYHARYYASEWEGNVRIDVCEPPRRLRLINAGEHADEHVTEVTLTADGDQTILVWEARGMPLTLRAAYGAGNQVHVEDLTAYLAGRERCDAVARWHELAPAYEALATSGAH